VSNHTNCPDLRLPLRRRAASPVRHRLNEDAEFIYGCAYDWNATINAAAEAWISCWRTPTS
jgi:hypothetical protein